MIHFMRVYCEQRIGEMKRNIKPYITDAIHVERSPDHLQAKQTPNMQRANDE